MADSKKIYPRTKDTRTVYLKNVITNSNIEVGDYTMYHDFSNDPIRFEQNNVLYHYPSITTSSWRGVGIIRAIS